MNTVFNNPADLTYAIIAKAQGWQPRVPTVQEQLAQLVQPGRVVAFRTESGSLYEMSIYSDGTSVLVKVDEESGVIKEVAKGTSLGAHDRDREVYGILILEPTGRQYTTSAVVKVWVTYDAVNNIRYSEPA